MPDAMWRDPTGERAVRRHVSEPEFSWSPSWDDDPAFAEAMELRPRRLREDFEAGVFDLHSAVRRKRGTLLAAERLLPFAMAFAFRSTVDDEAPRPYLRVVPGDDDRERREDGDRGEPCTEPRAVGESRAIVTGAQHEKQLLTVAEAARLLQRDESTVRKWAPTVAGSYIDPVTGNRWIPAAAVVERLRGT
jgi:hypothetical protein